MYAKQLMDNAPVKMVTQEQNVILHVRTENGEVIASTAVHVQTDIALLVMEVVRVLQVSVFDLKYFLVFIHMYLKIELFFFLTYYCYCDLSCNLDYFY